jgi:hypothetical protein
MECLLHGNNLVWTYSNNVMSLALIEWNLLFQVHEHFIDEVCAFFSSVGGAAIDKINVKDIENL